MPEREPLVEIAEREYGVLIEMIHSSQLSINAIAQIRLQSIHLLEKGLLWRKEELLLLGSYKL